MPTYIYKCKDCQSTRTVIHGFDKKSQENCHCGTVMHRVPQAFNVNWNGNPPSIGTHPLVEQLNATLPARRAAFEKRKYEHELSKG